MSKGSAGGSQGDRKGGDGDDPPKDLVHVKHEGRLEKGLLAMIRSLGVVVTERTSEALERGLQIATTGWKRVVVFSVSLLVGLLLTFLALEAAAAAGHMLGVPIYLLLALFVPIVFAMMMTAIPVLFNWLSTSSTEQALDVAESTRLQYQVVRALEAELRRSGLSEKEIQGIVVPKHLEIGTEALKRVTEIANGGPAKPKPTKPKKPKGAPLQIVQSTTDAATEKDSAQPPVPDDSKDGASPDSIVQR